MAQPCCRPSASARRIRRSNVPCGRSICTTVMLPLSLLHKRYDTSCRSTRGAGDISFRQLFAPAETYCFLMEFWKCKCTRRIADSRIDHGSDNSCKSSGFCRWSNPELGLRLSWQTNWIVEGSPPAKLRVPVGSSATLPLLENAPNLGYFSIAGDPLGMRRIRQ